MRCWLAALLVMLAGPVVADEMVAICHGYSCFAQADIRYSEGQLGDVRRLLMAAVDPESERNSLSLAIGLLYRWGGEQSAIHNDRGGNLADEYGSGRMDCIDHSTSTTRLLKMLENRGWLRWHRVLEPAVRRFALVFEAHWSAVIEAVGGNGAVAKAGDGEPGLNEQPEAARFVVDSWFVDNGQPAVILPLDEWKKGAGPDV
jgi:hypothetical protein